MSFLRQVAAVVRKDLLLEWRNRARALSVILFGIVALALFSFAVGAESATLVRMAPGYLVLTLLLSSTLALSESFRIEQFESALEGQLLLPVDPVALFYGKALGNIYEELVEAGSIGELTALGYLVKNRIVKFEKMGTTSRRIRLR